MLDLTLCPSQTYQAGFSKWQKTRLDPGHLCWNLSGGYHHASQHSIEGFCIYNDIGITYQELMARDLINSETKILIIDTDAHHGNGNARTFMENSNVTILDVYNADIYPTTVSIRQRVDVSVPLNTGVQGRQYLDSFQKGLS